MNEAELIGKDFSSSWWKNWWLRVAVAATAAAILTITIAAASTVDANFAPVSIAITSSWGCASSWSKTSNLLKNEVDICLNVDKLVAVGGQSSLDIA